MVAAAQRRQQRLQQQTQEDPLRQRQQLPQQEQLQLVLRGVLCAAGFIRRHTEWAAGLLGIAGGFVHAVLFESVLHHMPHALETGLSACSWRNCCNLWWRGEHFLGVSS
jgi:hypothetical protein